MIREYTYDIDIYTWKREKLYAKRITNHVLELEYKEYNTIQEIEKITLYVNQIYFIFIVGITIETFSFNNLNLYRNDISAKLNKKNNI